MTKDSDYIPRLCINLTDEQATKLRNLIPWGLQRQLFSNIIDEVIELLEVGGSRALAALVYHGIKPSELLPRMKEAKDESP